MTIKIGINGFGRIGRMVFRAAAQNFQDIEVVGINDLLEPDYLAYMLKYDSVHGRFKGEVSVEGNTLIVNGKKIRLTQERDPAALKWNEVGADIVVEATGLFLARKQGAGWPGAGARAEGCACAWHPFAHPGDGRSACRGGSVDHHWLLLHRHQSGGAGSGGGARHSRIQCAVFQYAIGRGTDAWRNHHDDARRVSEIQRRASW